MIPPESVARIRLHNGLTVLIHRDTTAPVAAVVTWVKAGYFDETDDVVGIAHVLEHMFFKGTPTRGVGEIARDTKASGGYLNAHTIYDHTTYFAVLPRDGFVRGLEVQADAYAHSLIEAGELGRELEVIIQEAKRKADSPSAVAIETLYELLHDRHRIRRWRIGREPGLRALTRDHLIAFYRNFYRPSNTVLVIAGDVDSDDTLRRVESLYGALDDGEPMRTPGPEEGALPGFRYRELAGDIAQTEVALGWRTPGTLSPETPALDLAATILGDGRGSRLYRGVRDRQLASSVSASNYTPTTLGIFDVHLQCPTGRARDAAAAAWVEVRHLAEHGPGVGEVARAQRLLEARWLRRLETMEGQATFLAEWEALGGWELAESYYGRLMTLTASDVQEQASRYLTADQVSLLVYRPRDEPAFATDVAGARGLLDGAAGTPAAVPESRAGPPAAARRPVALEQRVGRVAVFRAASGLPILVRRRPGTPLTHLGVFSGAGAAVEPGQLAGVTTLMARAALKGTARRTAAEVANESERLGGSIAPGVAADDAGWMLSVPATRTAAAVELLADVVLHPRFDSEAIDTERAVAVAQLARLRDDMMRYPIRLATAAAFGTHPYARSPLGTEASLAAVDATHVRAAHERTVLRAPALVAAAGDWDEEELASLLASHFGEIEPLAAVPVAPVEWPREVTAGAESRDKAQTGLAMLFPGPDRRDARRFAAQVTAGIASGLGGRFFEALREKRSLAYTVLAQAVERIGAGMFLAYIATSPEREEEARAGLLEEFARLCEEEVAADELERARVYAIGSHAIAQQSGGTVLNEMVDAWLRGTGLEELDAFDTNVRAVTARDIRELAESCFDPGRRAEGIVRGQPGRTPTSTG